MEENDNRITKQVSMFEVKINNNENRIKPAVKTKEILFSSKE